MNVHKLLKHLLTLSLNCHNIHSVWWRLQVKGVLILLTNVPLVLDTFSLPIRVLCEVLVFR